MTEGIFITIEGPNGAGKSTLMELVAERLRVLDFRVLETVEPSRSSLGDLVRRLERVHGGKTYACLIAADRYHHLESEIEPAIASGSIVISARYFESSLVLQGLDGVSAEFIWAINSAIRVPDLSIVLTADPDILEKRTAARPARSRFEGLHSRAVELNAYLEAADVIASKGFNVLRLENGIVSIEENADAVCAAVLRLIHRDNQHAHP